MPGPFLLLFRQKQYKYSLRELREDGRKITFNMLK
mgnify:CR=1 FL=1